MEDDETMDTIKRSEEKEALRTRPGYSFNAYASIAARTNNLNTHESTDRRIVFELTGSKLDVNGVFAEEDEDNYSERKINPSTEVFEKF
jgi:hypothetical protein